MANNVKAVIFDLDGTLADTMDDITASLNMMLRSCLYPERSREEAVSFINRGARNLVRMALPKEKQSDEEEVERCLKIYNGFYAVHYLDTIRLYGGIYELCEKLNSSGIKLAVLSNKPHRFVTEIIEKLMPGIFCEAIGQKDGLPHKPDPTVPLMIAEKLGAKPGEVVFCGDSDVDMTTAHNAGMIPIAVSWGYRSEDVLRAAGAKYMAHDAAELESIIYNM